MSITLFKAKNGQNTCSYNSILLHSVYNPEREASNFVKNISTNFIPSYIIITEPGLSYCEKYLRIRFPNTKLIAIRYTNFFTESNSHWDYVIYNYDSPHLFTDRLFSILSEEDILSSLFLAWKPSACFSTIDKTTWLSIKQSVERAQKVISTQQFFSKKWLKNIFKFCINLSSAFQIIPGHSPIVITASGPSLKFAFNFLKKYRKSFFLIAVSSSILPLLHEQIIPDLCISTDGGFWATKHLDILHFTNKNISIAASAESALNNFLLSGKNNIIPLTYNDSIENTFLKTCNIPTLSAVRNGTVSGTAIDLALSLTDGQIFCCGLDLCAAKGFQHTQPNALELSDCNTDTRLQPKEQRIMKQRFNSSSLEIYRNWFSSHNFEGRTFRIADNFTFSQQIASLRDVNSSYYKTQKKSDIFPKFIFRNTIKCNSFSKKSELIKTRKKTLLSVLQNLSSTDEWLKNIFPADFIVYSRCADNIEKKKLYSNLKEKNYLLLKKLNGFLKGN